MLDDATAAAAVKYPPLAMLGALRTATSDRPLVDILAAVLDADNDREGCLICNL